MCPKKVSCFLHFRFLPFLPFCIYPQHFILVSLSLFLCRTPPATPFFSCKPWFASFHSDSHTFHSLFVKQTTPSFILLSFSSYLKHVLFAILGHGRRCRDYLLFCCICPGYLCKYQHGRLLGKPVSVRTRMSELTSF